MTIDDIVSRAIGFYMDGSDSPSNFMRLVLCKRILHLDVGQRLRKEIDR